MGFYNIHMRRWVYVYRSWQMQRLSLEKLRQTNAVLQPQVLEETKPLVYIRGSFRHVIIPQSKCTSRKIVARYNKKMKLVSTYLQCSEVKWSDTCSKDLDHIMGLLLQFVVLALVAATMAAPQNQQDVQILRYDINNSGLDSYSFA